MLDQKPKFGPVHFDAGSTIIRQGDVPDKFYIITRGIVDVVRRSDDGHEESIDRLGIGEYFGEIGMVRRIRRVATIRALTDVELIAMDGKTFTNWMNRSALIRDEIEAVIEDRIRIETHPEPVTIDEDSETPPPAGIRQDEQATAHHIASAAAKPDPSTQAFPANSIIIQQGEPADTFYILLEGEVEIVKQQPNGEETLIARLGEGNYFGEIGLMEGRERMATVRAATDVRVVTFNRETFNSWLADSPSSKTELTETAEKRRKETGRLIPPADEPSDNA